MSEVALWCSVKKDFSKFAGKQLCWSLFFIKVAGMKHGTLLKKKLQLGVSLEFC